jgi:hypothetical protein
MQKILDLLSCRACCLEGVGGGWLNHLAGLFE